MPTINSINSGIPIEISKGGTNAPTMGTINGTMKYSGTTLATSSTALIDSSNRMTNTAQPAFLTGIAARRDNVTGDGTVYKIVWGSEIFDNAGNWDNTSTFTAPVTGIYKFDVWVYISGVTASFTSMDLSLVTTSATFSRLESAAGIRDSNNQLNVGFSTLASMSAGDTAYATIMINGGTKTADVFHTYLAYLLSYFSGYLKC